jgi:thymidylate kinase
MPIDKKLIFFTGLDRCGKTTTRKVFATKTNEQHFTFDRSFVDNFVFDKVYRKQEYHYNELRVFFRRFAQLGDVYIVYFLLNYDEINKRAEKTENIKYEEELLKRVFETFQDYLKIASECGVKVRYVTCDNKTVSEIVDEVIERTKQ